MSQQLQSADINQIFSLARHNRLAEVKGLLDQGIDPNVRDSYGNTVLIIAAQNGLKNVAKAALRNGGDINAKNIKGNTALHFAFAYGFGDTLGAYLISKIADDKVRNIQGQTCYDVACKPQLISEDDNPGFAPASAQPEGSSQKHSNKRDDGRTEEERVELADEMLSEPQPWRMVASPPLCLTYALRSEQVAWKIVEDDGEVIWMPYCAGRRKRGEEEEEEF